MVNCWDTLSLGRQPLFANTLDTARMLLVNALKVASSTTDDRLVYIDVPIDLNPNAVKLVEELKGSYSHMDLCCWKSLEYTRTT